MPIQYTFTRSVTYRGEISGSRYYFERGDVYVEGEDIPEGDLEHLPDRFYETTRLDNYNTRPVKPANGPYTAEYRGGPTGKYDILDADGNKVEEVEGKEAKTKRLSELNS